MSMILLEIHNILNINSKISDYVKYPNGLGCHHIAHNGEDTVPASIVLRLPLLNGIQEMPSLRQK